MKKYSIDYQAIGRRLQAVRREQNITQQELARLAGVSTSYIGHLERGLKRGSLDVMAEICGALGVGMDYLLFGEQQHPDKRAVIREYLQRQLAELSDSNHS